MSTDKEKARAMAEAKRANSTTNEDGLTPFEILNLTRLRADMLALEITPSIGVSSSRATPGTSGHVERVYIGFPKDDVEGLCLDVNSARKLVELILLHCMRIVSEEEATNAKADAPKGDSNEG